MFSDSGVDFSRLKGNLLDFKAYVADNKSIRMLKSAIEKLKVDSEVYVKELDKNESMLFVAFDKTKSIEDAVGKMTLTEIDLHAKYLDAKPDKIIKSTDLQIKENRQKLADMNKELEKISDENYSKLVSMIEMLEIERDRSEASAMFKKTDTTTVIEGWVPVKRHDELKAVVKKATNDKFVMENVETKELAPTYLNRKGIFKSFDYLMNFYSTPRSDEIDPTVIFIFCFSIFYGMMVSDVGYGIMSFLFVSWIAKRSSPEGLLHNVANIWKVTSVSAIFFGVLSNQYFGVALNQYIFPGLTQFNWFNDITSLIVITVIFGITQVSLGLLLGFVNNYQHKHMKHALAKLFSVTLLLGGTVRFQERSLVYSAEQQS